MLLNKGNNGDRRIIQLIQNFDIVQRQFKKDEGEVFNYKSDDATLNNQSHVVGAIGSINHDAKIKRFNTPFYPDIIVCTNVFKEGLNLHLFCNKVYH